jgi:ubiquinone biosynthesis protein
MRGLERGREFARRASQVIRVATRYGFGGFLARLGLVRLVPRTRREGPSIEHAGLDAAVRLRLALEELGPTYVKLGQVMATRADLFPEEYVNELRKLQDEVPPVPFESVRPIVEEELGNTLEELFASFDPEPSASASIGQVHHAALPSGELVAVKVQRPGIEATIEMDLAFLQFAAGLAERHFEWADESDLTGLVAEFARSLRQELDYLAEGHNTDRLRENLADDADVVIPRVFWDLTTRRVLTWERLAGAKPTDAAAVDELGVNRPEVAMTLADTILHQILDDGFFHADPHAGNVLVLPGSRIALMDFGSMGWLGREQREELRELLLGIFEEDARLVCEQVMNLGALSEQTDEQALEREVDVLVVQYRHLPPGEVRLRPMVGRLMALLFRHQVRMPSAFALLMKSLVITEGVCLALDPQFDVRRAAERYARPAIAIQAPREAARDLLRSLREVKRHVRLLPRQVTQLLAKAESGRLKLRLEYDRIEEPLGRLDVIANRIAYAMIVSAIVIASAQLAGVEVTMWAQPVPLGLIGFVMAAVMGLWLIVAIIRSGRL